MREKRIDLPFLVSEKATYLAFDLWIASARVDREFHQPLSII